MTYASPFDDPAYYMTEAEYEAAMAAWVEGHDPKARMVTPPEWLNRRPPMRSLPVESELAPQWFMAVGRRDSDGKPYIGLGVIEPDGTEREERYHPATNTRLHALLERYLNETEGK